MRLFIKLKKHQLFLSLSIILIFIAPSLLASPSYAQDTVQHISLPDGTAASINWSYFGGVEARGLGVAPDNASSEGHRLALARRAAITDAQRSLLEVLKGIHLHSNVTMNQAWIESDIVKTEVEGLLQGAKIVDGSEIWDSQNNLFEVILRIPLTEVRKALPPIRATDRLAEFNATTLIEVVTPAPAIAPSPAVVESSSPEPETTPVAVSQPETTLSETETVETSEVAAPSPEPAVTTATEAQTQIPTPETAQPEVAETTEPVTIQPPVATPEPTTESIAPVTAPVEPVVAPAPQVPATPVAEMPAVPAPVVSPEVSEVTPVPPVVEAAPASPEVTPVETTPIAEATPEVTQEVIEEAPTGIILDVRSFPVTTSIYFRIFSSSGEILHDAVSATYFDDSFEDALSHRSVASIPAIMPVVALGDNEVDIVLSDEDATRFLALQSQKDYIAAGNLMVLRQGQ